MIYSVFDWNKGDYLYFEGLGDANGLRPKPVAVHNDPRGRGRQLEGLLSTVPPDAKQVGRGAIPKGRIATLRNWQVSGLGLTGQDELAGGLGSGFGDINEPDVVENPLIAHPWRTLAIWAGIVYASTRFAFYLGQRAERALRG